MNDMFRQMLEAKKADGKEISPVEKEATGNVLQDLMSYLSSMQGDKVKGLKKVTVASNDPKGLEEGLSKAKELIGKDGSDDESSDDESMEDPSEEASESPDMEASEDEHEDSPEALKKQIEMLKAQLASK